MFKRALAVTVLAAAIAAPAYAAQTLLKAPPGHGYKQVSGLVKLPEFVPGLGKLYVKPATLPAGPFLAYDRSGKLVSTIYMIPIKDIDEHKPFEELASGPKKVDHVDLYYNAGHPGVEVP
ncbi:MAG: DUF5602 domain-containing protein, partial [Burkholderiales bacterium]